MSYISTEEVAKKRKLIKKTFKNWKFSITKRHHSSLEVDILEADVQLLLDETNTHESVNDYHIESHYKDKPEAKELLLILKNIMTIGQGEGHYDGDYGLIPDYYTRISVGTWDKPFKFVQSKNVKTEKVETQTKVQAIIIEGQVQIVDYSEKAIAVIGDTKPIKETLKALGGRFNMHLTYENQKVVGWIFPKTRQVEIRNTLNIPE